jgi:integrase
MIYKRRRRTQPGRRQEYSYCPMLWLKCEDGSRRQLWGGTFRTKAAAKAEERRLLQERDAGVELVKNKLTLNDVFDQYLTEKQTKVKGSTLQRSKELIEHLRPLLGSVQLVALKPARISEAYNRLLSNLAKRTVRHCHWQLHGALELAVNWGQIPTNVASRVTPPEPDDFEGRALTQAEVSQLLEAVTGTEYEALVWLALDSGARQGELLALQTGDVDLEHGLIHIRRSVRRIKGQGMVYSSPKTKLSKRTVEIAPATIIVLKAYRLAQKERRLRAGDLWDANSDLFFTNDLGGPLDGVGVTKGFQKLVTRAGLGRLRFHDLRHSSATRLLAAGARMDEIRARMGHSSIMTTVNTYGHQTSNGASVAEKMQGILTRPDAISDGWLANG